MSPRSFALPLAALIAGFAAWALWQAGRSPEPPPARAGDPASNVLLVTLDTTRADRLGVYGYDEIDTPHLDALAEEGAYFRYAVTSIPLTLPAHASLMTGSDPASHGVRDNGGFFLNDEAETLAESLGAAGFETAAVVAAFVLDHSRGLDQGFGEYDDEIEAGDERVEEVFRARRDGAEVVERAIRWWERHPTGRFFVWLHFYDPHHPYDPPPEFAERYAERPYDGEIAYTDALVGRVLAYLRSTGRYDSTLIVVVGDHGEGLDEHGEPDHGIFLYDSTMRVPLIMSGPAIVAGGSIAPLVRDIDVMPTILDHLGLDIPATVQGRSLLSLLAGRDEPPRSAYGESYYARFHYGWSELRSIRDARYKYIEAPTPELYDLRADPGELRNLASERSDVADEMRSRLAELSETAGATSVQTPSEASDPTAVERLRALGYVGSLAPVGVDGLADPKDKLEAMNLLIGAGRRTAEDLRAGRNDQVIREIEQVLRVEPNYVEGYQFLAAALLAEGEARRAIEILERGLALSPEDVGIRLALARAWVALGDRDTAGAVLRALVASVPKFVAAHYALAELSVETGDHSEALEQFEAVLALDPAAARAEYEIGMVHLRQGDLVSARRRIEGALARSEAVRDAHFNLALIAERESRLEDAARHYEQEVGSFAANAEAWTNLGILRMQLGMTDAAIEAFERLVTLRPDDARGYYLLAKAQLTAGRADTTVRRVAERAVELDPSSPGARELLRRLER